MYNSIYFYEMHYNFNFLRISTFPAEFKGKVACVMGMNELMITELVVGNILTKLPAPEGAALLSALVYRVKVKEAVPDFENLPPSLIKVSSVFILLFELIFYYA